MTLVGGVAPMAPHADEVHVVVDQTDDAQWCSLLSSDVEESFFDRRSGWCSRIDACASTRVHSAALCQAPNKLDMANS